MSTATHQSRISTPGLSVNAAPPADLDPEQDNVVDGTEFAHAA